MRQKHSGLDTEEFHQTLRDFGFVTAKIGKVEYEKDSILELFKEIRERNPALVFQPAHFLKDLITTVPLFNKEGETYKWAHKSVQEYFASQFLSFDAKEHQISLLNKIYNGGHCKRLENVLDLLEDSDPRAFKFGVLKPWLEDFKVHIETKYNHDYGVPESEVIRRRSLSFGAQVAIFLCRREKIHDFFGKNYKSLVNQFQKKLRHNMGFIPNLFGFGDKDSQMILVLGYSPTASLGLHSLLIQKGYTFIQRPKQEVSMIPNDVQGALKHEQVYVVRDSPDDVLNSVDIFTHISNCLLDFGCIIDETGAIRALDLINNEPGEKCRTDQLFSNL